MTVDARLILRRFRVEGLGSRVWGLGFRVRVYGLGFRVLVLKGMGFRGPSTHTEYSFGSNRFRHRHI